MVDYQVRDEIRKLVEKFGRCVSKEFDLHFLYLFGSYAKGESKEDSDIDLAVVAEGFSGDLQEDTMRLMKIRRDVDYRIEPHPFPVRGVSDGESMGAGSDGDGDADFVITEGRGHAGGQTSKHPPNPRRDLRNPLT